MSKLHGAYVRDMVGSLNPELAAIAESTANILDGLGEEYNKKCEDYVLNLAGILTGGHFNETAAKLVIGRMKATELVTPDGSAFNGSVADYLANYGLTAERARSLLSDAYMRMVERATENTLPALPAMPEDVTEWDCLVLLARAFADYWSVVFGNFGTAAELAVSDIVDRDGEWSKKWANLIG